jgi:hypothetical protein
MTVKKTSTIDPDENSLIFDGHLVAGYAKGTQVTISYSEDAFTEVVGNDGEVSRTKSNVRSATVEVTVLQSSFTNDAFSDRHNEDLLNGNKVVQLSFKDNRGTTTLDGSGAYIKKFADVTISDTTESRVWTIFVSYLEGKVGGNFNQIA